MGTFHRWHLLKLINGFDGSDTFRGMSGNDTLDGGAGADSMAGDVGDGALVHAIANRRQPTSGFQSQLQWRSVCLSRWANDSARVSLQKTLLQRFDARVTH
jgi:hypothetical protein